MDVFNFRHKFDDNTMDGAPAVTKLHTHAVTLFIFSQTIAMDEQKVSSIFKG